MFVALILALTLLAPQAPRGRGRRMPQPASTNPFRGNREAIAEGRELYNKSCTVCHGLEGTAGDRAPALAAGRRYIRNSDDDMFAAVKKGIPGTLMPPMGLADDVTWKILAYIRSLRATASEELVEGSVEQGEALFEGKAGCAQCHMIRGRGGLLGPDLSNVAAERSLRYLRQALTAPRTPIPPGYRPVSLVTRAGEKIEGLIRNENNFSMQIMDRNYRLHLLARDEIAKAEYAKESWMPYRTNLSASELQDLLAFLSRQVAR